MKTVQNNQKPFEITFSSFAEAWDFAVKVSKSSFIPAPFRGKPDDILMAIQLGAEVGLKPMQALQGISLINNKPTMWGDSLLAICRNHPDFVSIEETFDEQTMTATCSIARKNQPIIIRKFSMADAKKANLNTRAVWLTYPNRMLMMRARGFAIRDAFADAIKGLMPREEVEDYQDISKTKEEKVERIEKVEKTENKNEIDAQYILETFKDDGQIPEDELNLLEKEEETKEVKEVKKERKTKKQEKEQEKENEVNDLELKNYYIGKEQEIEKATTIDALKDIYNEIKTQCNNDPNIMINFQSQCHSRKNYIMKMEEDMNNNNHDEDNAIPDINE